MEYRRPPPGRRAGRPRRDTPPPLPPTGPQAAGAPAPTPRGRGDGPPPPERGAGVRPAPPPQPPAPMGAAKNKRAHTYAPGCRTDRTQRSLVSTNRSGMGGHAPHGQHNASDARFVACPGKAEGRNEAERPPALQAPPRPHNRGVRRTPPPPPARPPAYERHGPAPRRAAPTGTEQGPHTRPPAPATRGSLTPTARPVGGQSGEGERMTRDAPRNGRRHPPRGRPAATPTTPSQVGGNRDRTAPPQARQTEQGTGAGHAEGHGPRGTALPAPSPGTTRDAHATPPRGGGSGHRESASAHTRKGHAGTPEGQPDRARGTHRPRGMAYQRARVRDTRTGRPGTRSAEHAGRGGGNEQDTTPGTGPNPPNRPRAPRTHRWGTAPAKAVVAHSATPQPLG